MAATILCDPATFQWAGTFGLTLIRGRRRKSPFYGFGYSYTFKGLPASINAAYLSLADDQEGETDEQGPFHTLTIFTADDPTNSTSNVLSHSFEIHGNNNQDDIVNHPLVKRLQPITIGKLSNVVSKALAGDYAAAADLNSAITTALSVETDNALKTFATTFLNSWLKRRGSMAFTESQYVFRVTTIISRRGVIPIVYGNTNKRFSNAQLQAETNPTPRYTEGLNTIMSGLPAANIGHTWAWLKMTPTLTTVAANKEAAQNEYYLGEWEDWVYPAKA